MMSAFIANNRAELITRCAAQVAQRPRRSATPEQLSNGIPIFIDQLQMTLEAEEGNDMHGSLRISGASGGDRASGSEIGTSAAAHGKQLLELGYTIDQVVHDYGDLCQAITGMAVERDAPFGVSEFQTLNRCLDNAIADAVTEFSFQRDRLLEQKHANELNETLGSLAHEQRNAIIAANLAVAALEAGGLPIAGATGTVLKRALKALTTLINQSIEEARGKSAALKNVHSLAELIEDAGRSAALYAQASGCHFTVRPVDPFVEVSVDRDRILGAIANLVQNAFKFTLPGSGVELRATTFGHFVRIEVQDHCGGLPHGSIERMFSPFTQRSSDKSGLGLGLSIARHSVELDGGELTVQDLPGSGCIFTIVLPRHQGLRLAVEADTVS